MDLLPPELQAQPMIGAVIFAVIWALVGLKIFARSQEVSDLKTSLSETKLWVSQNFVEKNSMDELKRDMDQKLNEIRELLLKLLERELNK